MARGGAFGVIVSALAVSIISAAPRIRVSRDTGAAMRLGLPSNATSIRIGELSERFSCMGRHYGYYADPDNDCQLFHVCLPVQFDDGRSSTYKWSFVCPEETIFNQETFTCTRREDAINCEDSERFYNLNEGLGKQDSESDNTVDHFGHRPINSVDDQSVSISNRNEHYGDNLSAGTSFEQLDNGTSTTETQDEVTFKYGAFTTIRY